MKKFKCEPIKPTPVILKVNNIRTIQINPQDATATPNDVEEGKIFYGKEGREVGTYKKKILTRIVIEPSKEIQNILPESPYDGFSEIEVNKIPDEYIIPEGTLKIEENGIKNVTNYSEVEVEVYDDLNSELNEQETLLEELKTQVDELGDDSVSKRNIETYKYQDIVRATNHGGTLATDEEYEQTENYLQSMYALIMGG